MYLEERSPAVSDFDNNLALNDKPTVSVCIATYNHARFLPKCLDSILAQTYRDFEIVIVDDGSEDGSHDLLLNYTARYPHRIRHYWHSGHQNLGVSISQNLAIRKSHGKHIAFIGADDMWYPSKLSYQVSLLNDRPDIGLVYGIAEYIDENDKVLPGAPGGNVTKELNPLGKMLVLNYTPAMTVILRRECLDHVGLFEESLDYSDWDLMVKMFSHYRAGFIDRPLAGYRVHTSNMSIGIDPRTTIKRNLDVLCGLKRNAPSIGGALVEAHNLAILDLQIAFHMFCQGSEEETRFHVEEAYDEDPEVYIKGDSISKWSSQWRQEFYDWRNRHFGFWVVANFPSRPKSDIIRNKLLGQLLTGSGARDFFIEQGIRKCEAAPDAVEPLSIFDNYGSSELFPKAWRREIIGKVHAGLLFDCYKDGNVERSRHHWLKAVATNPRLLADKGILSIGRRVFLK